MLHDRRTRHIGDDLSVRDRPVAAIDGERDGERRLERRFVEAGKCAARIGRFELSHGVRAIPSLAQIEPAQLIVEDAGVPDMNLVRAAIERARHRQRRRLALLVQHHRRLLRGRAGADGHVVNYQLERMEDDSRGRLSYLDADSLCAIESRPPKVDRECQVVVLGADVRRKSLCDSR